MRTTVAAIERGGEAWCAPMWVCIDTRAIALSAPMWAEGDAINTVMITKDLAGRLHIWSEDTEQARKPAPTPAIVADQVTIVPSVRPVDLYEEPEWGGAA